MCGPLCLNRIHEFSFAQGRQVWLKMAQWFLGRKLFKCRQCTYFHNLSLAPHFNKLEFPLRNKEEDKNRLWWAKTSTHICRKSGFDPRSGQKVSPHWPMNAKRMQKQHSGRPKFRDGRVILFHRLQKSTKLSKICERPGPTDRWTQRVCERTPKFRGWLHPFSSALKIDKTVENLRKQNRKRTDKGSM